MQPTAAFGSIRPFAPDRSYGQFLQGAPPIAPFYGSPSIRDFQAAPNAWTALPDSIPRWPLQKLPLTVFIASGAGVTGYSSTFHDLFIRALSEWSQVSDGKLRFQLVTDPDDADITVGWESSGPGNAALVEAGNTLTTASISRRTGIASIEHARIMLLTQVQGVSFGSEEFKKIALHEIGHAIGIKEHSPFPADIMYAVTSHAQKPMLSAGDISSINQLYRSYPAAANLASMK